MIGDPKPKRKKRRKPPGYIPTSVRLKVWARCTDDYGRRHCEVSQEDFPHDCLSWATELSHVIAASRGGKATPGNLNAACFNGARAQEKKTSRDWQAGKAYGHRKDGRYDHE